MNLKELIDISDTDTQFDIKTIDSTIMKNSNNYSKWLSFLSQEGLNLKKLTLSSEQLYAKLYRQFRWEDEADIVRGEIPDLIKGNEEYQSIQKLVEISKQKINLIEGTLKAINSLGFNTKNFIEWEKLKNGAY